MNWLPEFMHFVSFVVRPHLSGKQLWTLVRRFVVSKSEFHNELLVDD